MTHLTVASVGRAKIQDQLEELEKFLGANVLGFVGPIVFGVDDLVRQAIESLPEKRSKLVIVLDTGGGIVEVVERMVDTVRHHFREVVFAIPDRAMSAGTIFALSGDAILMDYYSVMGPIDPQVEKGDRLMPAQAYLDEFDRLVVRASEGKLTTAEIILLQKMDLGELQQFREAKDLSVDLLERWLVKYKFKDWKVTQTQELPVDDKMRSDRAKDIAKKLGDAKRWHAHGRGIPMATLSGEDLRLKIEDFGATEGLPSLLRGYLLLLKDYMREHQMRNFVHTKHHF